MSTAQTRRGFSLIEVIISGVLFLVALTGIIGAMSSSGAVRINARQHSEATEIAEEQMELLLAAARGAPELSPDIAHEERRRPDGTVAADGIYQLRWTVAPLAAVPTISRVVVEVVWQGPSGERRLSLETNRD